MDTPLAARNLRELDGIQTPSAVLDLPSPASDIDVFTPSLGQGPLSETIANDPWSADDSLVSTLVAPEPDTVVIQPAVSPAHELEQPGLQFDALVGARVDPAPRKSPLLPCSKAVTNLRLPSFSDLGIAAPHSERLHRPALERSTLCLGDASYSPQVIGSESVELSADLSSSDVLHEHVNNPQLETSPRAQAKTPVIHSPLQHYVTTLTPPDDNGRITWESITKIAGPMGSPDCPEVAPPASQDVAPSVSQDVASIEQSGVPQITIQATTTTPLEQTSHPWLQGAIRVMLTNINSGPNLYAGPIKVLSHALPCPSTEGHAFPAVISSLHDQTPTSPTCWINVFHALPGRFNLSDLPTSPPSTPGPPVGGDDYFTSKIFDSAVQILDYADNLKTLPQSPRPIVPPSSVDVSIVERYIPPTNINEFAEMFNIRGPSLLVDRLVELSPDNGTLIFIYPTKRGAQTFMADYLGPVLDPILRSMVVVHGFSSDMGLSLGKMVAVDSLPDHDTMKRRILQLCTSLSQSGPGMEKFQKKPTNFSLIYSTTEEVKLERKIWAESWWSKQEKPRIRETISRYFRRANRAQEDQTPVSLVHEVLEGVATKPYSDGEETRSGIEVSAFVITRTR